MSPLKTPLSYLKQLKLKLAFEGLVIGIISGLVVVFYRLILQQAEHIRQFVANHPSPLMIIGWFILLIAAALFVGRLMIKDPMICGSGIPQVEGVLANKIKMNPVSVLIRKLIGGTLCIGAGLSVGREGPSIQLGAVTAQWVSRLTKRTKLEEKYLFSSGASAGLAAAFNAPLAGVMFALEEVHKHFSPLVLVCAMSAALTADFVSKNFFGLKPVFNFHLVQAVPLGHYGYIIILGLLTGVLGVLYNKTLAVTLKGYDKLTFLKKQYHPLIPFLLAGILVWILPDVLGGGHTLIEKLSEGPLSLNFLFLLLVMKFAFSMVSFASGVPGGIFFPLLVLGALTGSIFGHLLEQLQLIDGNLIQNFIILAMAGYFSAIVRAPITGSILIAEMTGSFTNLLPLSLVGLIAYTVAEGLRNEPVYDFLLHRLLHGKDTPKASEKNILVEVPVFADSSMDGRLVRSLDLPTDCLLIAIKRGSEELIPRGDTKLVAGDDLIILMKENLAADLQEHLKSTSQKVPMY